MSPSHDTVSGSDLVIHWHVWFCMLNKLLRPLQMAGRRGLSVSERWPLQQLGRHRYRDSCAHSSVHAGRCLLVAQGTTTLTVSTV